MANLSTGAIVKSCCQQRRWQCDHQIPDNDEDTSFGHKFIGDDGRVVKGVADSHVAIIGHD